MAQSIIIVLQRNLRQALGKRQYEQAASILEHLQQEDPLSVETRGLELEFLVRSGRLQEAKSLSVQLLELFPTSRHIQYMTGLLCYRQKNYAPAEQHFRECEGIHTHWSTRRWLGKTLTQLGRFDQAESLLQGLLPEHLVCRLDLVWLYQRMKDDRRALKQVEMYLQHRPHDGFALKQRLILRAQLLPPEELVEEVDALLELGEEVPVDLLPAYLENLLSTGQGVLAREFVYQRLAGLDIVLAGKLGWVCHKTKAHDLTLELFLRAFPANLHYVKFLNTLEFVAGRCSRLGELIDLYEAFAEQEHSLYGRQKTLAKRLEQAQEGQP